MFYDTNPEIIRHTDGSIDYRHYTKRAAVARNSEFRHLIREVIAAPVPRSPLLSVLATILLLVLIL